MSNPFAAVRDGLQKLDNDLRSSFVCQACGKPTAGIIQGHEIGTDGGLCACPTESRKEKQVRAFRGIEIKGEKP